MSGDGQVWTEPGPVLLEGTAAQTVATPSIFNDGTLYSLIWLAPDGAVRFASSRDATSWIQQATPLAQLPPTSSPILFQGLGKRLALLGNLLIDLSNGNRTLVMPNGVTGSISYAGSQFVLAMIGPDRGVHLFTSPDGATWHGTAVIPAARFSPAQIFIAEVGWGEGRFVLATRGALSSGADRCFLFESTDAVQWTQDPLQNCASNNSTGMRTTRFNGNTLVFENFSNLSISASINGGQFGDTHVFGVNGRPDFTIGGGPQIAWLNLKEIDVTNGPGQNLTLITLGFHSRVGVAGSARVIRPNRGLYTFATGRHAGDSSTIPPVVSPLVFVVQQPQPNLMQPSEVDIMGAVLIGLDRGGCPEGRIDSQIENARAALEDSLNNVLVTTPISTLQDPVQAKAIFEQIKADVMRRLGGNPSTGPIGWLKGAVDSVGKFVVCNILDSLGGGVDDQFSPSFIVLVGAPVDDDPARGIFGLHPITPVSPLALQLQNEDASKRWVVNGTRNFLGLPL